MAYSGPSPPSPPTGNGLPKLTENFDVSSAAREGLHEYDYNRMTIIPENVHYCVSEFSMPKSSQCNGMEPESTLSFKETEIAARHKQTILIH